MVHVIEVAAPMHDIGKIGIPDSVLIKEGPLSPAELEIMRTHPRIGYDILKGSPSKYLSMGSIIALGHHEKYDGTGYPNGLHGEDIPIVARVVAVADVFDALVSERPYKHAWPLNEGIDFLKSQRGKHFDPKCVDAFLADRTRIEAIYTELADYSPNRRILVDIRRINSEQIDHFYFAQDSVSTFPEAVRAKRVEVGRIASWASCAAFLLLKMFGSAGQEVSP